MEMEGDLTKKLSEKIKEKTKNFNLVESHRLLKIIYTLNLTNMKETFSSMINNRNQSFFVCLRS